MEQPHLPARAIKILRLEGGSIGLRKESWVNWDGLVTMVPCFHQGNIYTKRKLRVWRDQKCIPLVGGTTPFTCGAIKIPRLEGGSIGPTTESLGKLGWTYGHGTVFPPRKYLHQKEATGMERPEMYSASRCNKPTYLCGPFK